MKKILALLLINIFTVINAQTYPLRTYSDVPSNSYIMDSNNELNSYEGAWKGSWNGKSIIITFKKIKKYWTYNEDNPYYKDILIGKFKVIDSNGSVLFDNTNISDNDSKINGGNFRTKDNKYSFWYNDEDLCGLNGYITINFTDNNKNKIQWNFSDMTDIILPDCPYKNGPFPEPLPKNIILTKQ
ncbi:DUF6705 family protein [Chryseobacterium sp. CT-SW4]|uniref:DUF6705 family protein n=1 Tax=Chryseobacterium sp. SW-1 TaxID=3157343 RepID=UPI003B024A5B